MKINAVWTEEIPRQIPSANTDDIQVLFQLLDFLDDNNIENYIDDVAVYEVPEFCEWIYSKDSSDLNDLKRELMKKMARYQHVDHDRLCELLADIGKAGGNKKIGIDFREENLFYTCTLKKLYRICRIYLNMENRSDFAKDLSFCYPNIYFDVSVQSSLHTLNRRFEEIRGEIVGHLTELNDYRDRFLQLTKENKGYRDIALEFQREKGIECSPQAGRRSIGTLKRTFFNQITKETEVVVCELHTKFKRYNIDREKQDRIYFAPAKEGIQSGKVLVIHIGTHQ